MYSVYHSTGQIQCRWGKFYRLLPPCRVFPPPPQHPKKKKDLGRKQKQWTKRIYWQFSKWRNLSFQPKAHTATGNPEGQILKYSWICYCLGDCSLFLIKLGAKRKCLVSIWRLISGWTAALFASGMENPLKAILESSRPMEFWGFLGRFVWKDEKDEKDEIFGWWLTKIASYCIAPVTCFPVFWQSILVSLRIFRKY